jgi:oligopeptide transport system substrate-binding protein
MNVKKINRLLFFLCLSLIFTGCKQNNHSKDTAEQVVKISMTADPQTLDPRYSRSLQSVTLLHMLYEGLMRSDFQGRTVPGIAQHVVVSEDLKVFTFHLRASQWSNGDPLTAMDFIDTWRDILNPEFAAPNAYQFYLIKGAKEAKEGKISLNKVGIKAKGPLTLVVELEAPTPYFLDLLTTHFFYPVHRKFSEKNAISNGPFILEEWKKHQELSVVKNPNYWDAVEVRLNKIALLPLDEHTALRMFESGELEWAGSPIGTIPQDAIQTLKHRHQLHFLSAAGTHWLRINTARLPFHSVKMRQAFGYSLNRKSIVEHVIQGNQKAATGIVPPSFGISTLSFFEDNDVPKSWYAFQEALEEMKISKDELPSITLCYANNERNRKLAQVVQQQWKKSLSLDIQLESCESQVFYDRLSKQSYQIAMGSWFADYKDPINFLEIFKYKSNSTNNTAWENQEYIKLLNQSAVETDQNERVEILKQAEALLMKEMPVIPLFFGVFNYVKSENLYGVYFSELGYLDFKYAFYGD